MSLKFVIFMKDLCKSFAFAHTPLVTLNNPKVRNFHVMCNQSLRAHQRQTTGEPNES